MTMTLIRSATTLCAMLAVLLAGAALAADKEEPREGGLTGTGIVGVITRLGSFYVNGHRVSYAPGAQVQSDLGTLAADDLRPGDSIAVQVTLADERWIAEGIRQLHPVVGPVSAVEDGLMTVMGTRVSHGADDLGLAVGDWVAVGGLWRGDQVVATRIDRIAPQPRAHITGSYFAPDAGAPLRVGGSIIDGIRPEHASEGDVIRISGIPSDSGLQAERLDLGLFDQPLGVVLAQGYLSTPGRGGHYTVLGSGLSAFTEDQDMVNPAEVSLLCGVRGHLVMQPQSLDAPTRAVLARLGCAP